MNTYLVVIIAYIILVIGIGLSVRKHVHGISEFLVGGRSFGTGLLFITLISANIGAGSTVGVSGLGYLHGWSAWWWMGTSAIGSFLLAYTVGPKIWTIATKYNLYTLGDYLDQRYHPTFRLLMSVMMAIGTLALFAGQLIGISWILSVVAGTSKVTGILIGAGVVSVYFMIGGLLSSTIVNIFQVAMILLGFLGAIPFILQYFGGWQPFVDQINSNIQGTDKADTYFSLTGIGLRQIITYTFMLVPSFIISPGLIQKVFGAKDEKSVKRGTALNGVVQLLFAFVPVFIGMAAFAAFPDLQSQELALPTVMKEMLPVWVGAFALAAIFAAEVSTADAVLFMITSSMTKDIYAAYINKKATDQQLLRVSRIITIISGLISVILALYLPSIIASLSIFYSLMSVALTAPLIFGLYTRGAKVTAAFLASGLGILVTLWMQYGTETKGWSIFSAQSIGMIVSIGLMIVLVFVNKGNHKNID